MPKKSEHGNKTAAGLLLSKFLRIIAEERTEISRQDGCPPTKITKAESLARLMWKMSLGYKEIVEDGKGGTKTTIHSPDRGLMALLFDRIDGKAPLVFADGNKRSVPDKVDEQSAARIEEAGGLNSD